MEKLNYIDVVFYDGAELRLPSCRIHSILFDKPKLVQTPTQRKPEDGILVSERIVLEVTRVPPEQLFPDGASIAQLHIIGSTSSLALYPYWSSTPDLPSINLGQHIKRNKDFVTVSICKQKCFPCEFTHCHAWRRLCREEIL